MEATLIPPSLLAISTLEPIPQSVAPTPALRESPPPAGEAGPSNYQIASLDSHTPGGSDADIDGIDGLSRRSSVSSYHPISGSYFPANTSSRSYFLPSSNGSTPNERPRPAPLHIPAATPDEPLFSAYPNTGNSHADAKGKGRSFNFQLRPAFNLSHPGNRRRKGEDGESSADERWLMPLTALTRISRGRSQTDLQDESPSPPCSPASRNRHQGRRRAVTVSHSPTSEEISGAERHKHHGTHRNPVSASPHPRPADTTPKSFRAFRKRRASVGHVPAPISTEYEHPSSTPLWSGMAEAVAQRFDLAPPIPFSYQLSPNSQYTLQSVSTITTVRPLASPALPPVDLPSIAPRRSSLHPDQTILGLTNVAVTHGHPEPPVEIIMPDDLNMPHDPPPRRSSLDYGHRGYKGISSYKIAPDTVHPLLAMHLDGQSVLSASLTATDTSASASADAFSPSGSSKEHPLSSATTSLSRSAKSGKEGSDDKDAALSALRLQRSLEWEARQKRHRRKLEHRKMVLLELVETEVAYNEDLKTLAHVYLPQLAALPNVTDRTSKMIARNTSDLLVLHTQVASKMVDVLKEEGVGYEYTNDEPDIAGKVDRVSRRLAALFVDEIASFSLYKEFCAGSIVASTLVRHISVRHDYDAFERRCQFISATQPYSTLKDLLGQARSPGPLNRSRLHFKDYLITPIQRICRYPLLLGQLLEAVEPPSPNLIKAEPDSSDDDNYDIGVDIERALGAMRGVAEEADEARRLKDTEVKSATVLERFEPHISLSPTFLRSLGTCRLIGSLDVLHHHPTIAPLLPPVKVKYLGAFLYRGYLILAKVKKTKVYEVKHFLPLEVFELIDITEGFLPHSIRLRLRDHNFDLAASCEAEKEVWAAAICEARDESNVPPFELPASVSPFAARPRRMSAAAPLDFDPAIVTESPVSTMPTAGPNKRHTLAEFGEMPQTTTVQTITSTSRPTTPTMSPIRASFSFTPDRRSAQPGTILLRRASTNQRLQVDRGLLDIFSDSCSTARNKAQLHHALFLPDVKPEELRDGMSIRESTLLRRRRSFLDSKAASFDIAFTGEIKGSVIQVRPTRATAGKYRNLAAHANAYGRRASSVVSGSGRGTEDSADETATATAHNSDFGTGTLRRDFTRSNSVASFSTAPAPTPKRSVHSFRERQRSTDREDGLMMRSLGKSSSSNTNKNRDVEGDNSQALLSMTKRPGLMEPRTRWKTSSSSSSITYGHVRTGSRSKSMPASPAITPQIEIGIAEEEVPPIPEKYSTLTNTQSHSKSKSSSNSNGRSWTPPLIRKGFSDQTYHRERTKSEGSGITVGAGEYYIPPPHGLPLDTIGNNVSSPGSTSITPIQMSSSNSTSSSIGTSTNNTNIITGTGAWGNLRRSMSFLATASKSRTSIISMNMDDGDQSNPNSNSNSNSNSSSASTYNEGDSSIITHGNEDEINAGVTGDGAEVGAGTSRSASVPNTPRRKRSIRLFNFKGFTPM